MSFLILKDNRINNIYKHTIVYIALALSTLNLFINTPKLKYSIIIISLFLLIFHNFSLNKKIIKIIGVYFILIIINVFLFNKNFTSAFIKFIYEVVYLIILPFIFIRIINKDFPKYYINILYFFSIISLLFWTFSNIFPTFYDFTRELPYILKTDPVDISNPLAGNPEQFILYTFEQSKVGGLIRNPGSFHEPGAFSVFLIVGIIFNYILNVKLFNKKGIVFIITLLTTFSSAGYIALFIIILLTLFYNSKIKRFYKVLIFIFSSVLFSYLFFNLDFLSNKLEHQYEIQKDLKLDKPTSGRLFAARKAINLLKKYPLTGKNLLVKDSYENLRSEDSIVYGLLNTLTKFGIPITFLLLYLSYTSFKIYCYQNKLTNRFYNIAIIPFIIVLTAQSFYITPIILMLTFYPTLYSNKYLKILFSKTKPFSNRLNFNGKY